MNTISITLNAGNLGKLTGTLCGTSGIVRCQGRGTLDRFTAARTLRAAVEDGRIEVPASIRAQVSNRSLVLMASVSR